MNSATFVSEQNDPKALRFSEREMAILDSLIDTERRLTESLESKDLISKRAEAIRCELVESERRLTAVTAQRDAAWATIAAIKKDFVDDESFGKVVDTLFAEPLIEAERKLGIARDEINRFRERFKLIDSMRSCSEQRGESWTAMQNFDIYFEQALTATAP